MDHGDGSFPFVRRADVIVVGGGLAGLVGGRADRTSGPVGDCPRTGADTWAAVPPRTFVTAIHWNLGPHALYCAGHAFRLFKELGIPFSGRFPNPGRGLLVNGSDDVFPIPAGLGSLIGHAASDHSREMATGPISDDADEARHAADSTASRCVIGSTRRSDRATWPRCWCALSAQHLLRRSRADVGRRRPPPVEARARRQCLVPRRRLADACRRPARPGAPRAGLSFAPDARVDAVNSDERWRDRAPRRG